VSDDRGIPRLPVVNSEYLFRLLAKRLGAELICDVGAFDCAHSRRFRGVGARVVAIEANPVNFDTLVADASIRAAGIELLHCAAWNRDGEVTFNVIQVPDGSRVNQRNPISSVLARTRYQFESRPVTVRAARLDTIIRKELKADAVVVALWIDTEGAAYEVLQGMGDVRSSVCVVHVEVETDVCWQDQRLWPAVAALMRDFGFTPIARGPGHVQFDVVFVNDRWRRQAWALIRWSVLLAWCRLRAARLRRGIWRSP
jgi:FkbM family methyltransferase